MSQNRRTLILNGIFSGLSLGIAALFRSSVAIIVIAYAVYTCVLFTKRDGKRKLIWRLLDLLIILFAYFMVVKGIDHIVRQTVSPFGISNNCPLWQVICGLTPENHGQYCETYVEITRTLNRAEQYEIFKASFAEIFNNIGVTGFIQFIFDKIYYMWGNFCGTFGINSDSLFAIAVLKGTEVADKILSVAVLIASAVGIRKYKSNSGQYDANVLLLYIVVIGYFMAYIFFEANIKYRYETIGYLIMISSIGFDSIRTRLGCSKKAQAALVNT